MYFYKFLSKLHYIYNGRDKKKKQVNVSNFYSYFSPVWLVNDLDDRIVYSMQ